MIPIENEMTYYYHKGRKLTPLKPEEALSLDERDKIKFIGSNDHKVYHIFQRRVHTLPERPKIHTSAGGKLLIQVPHYAGYPDNSKSSIFNWALVERGDRHGVETSRAKRFIPINLKAFRRDLQVIADRTKKRIDRSLEDLPLHKKMEALKLSPEDQKIYDFIYEDFDVVLGLKEEKKDEG